MHCRYSHKNVLLYANVHIRMYGYAVCMCMFPGCTTVLDILVGFR